ncbi:unnamed protein product [Prorocentrum cordatum]|uniref:Uncharacterized protein n=1 Tax=Prorocentrum cordatum TaxID=2364126 RepID=A0ABN9RVC8_9DINO|nr:unnamed protein product [Polarella glacialis]
MEQPLAARADALRVAPAQAQRARPVRQLRRVHFVHGLLSTVLCWPSRFAGIVHTRVVFAERGQVFLAGPRGFLSAATRARAAPSPCTRLAHLLGRMSSLARNVALLRSRELGASTAQPQHQPPAASFFDRKLRVVQIRSRLTEEQRGGLGPAPAAEPEGAVAPLCPETAPRVASAGETTSWAGAAVLALRARRPSGGPAAAEGAPAAASEPAAEPAAEHAQAARPEAPPRRPSPGGPPPCPQGGAAHAAHAAAA